MNNSDAHPQVHGLEKTIFLERHQDFSSLLTLAMQVWNRIPESPVGDSPEQYCQAIFTKLIAHGLSLRKLLPSEPRQPGFFFDVSSVAVLSRCIMEAYDALAYIALQSISPAEEEFRILLWRANDFDRRVKMFRNFDDFDTASEKVASWRAGALEDLRKSNYFISLNDKIKKKILEDIPPYHISQAERNLASGVNEEYYRLANMLLSQHVHTYSFAIHHLSNHIPETEVGYRDINVALIHSLTFVSKSISDIIEKFIPDFELSAEDSRLLSEYLEFFKKQE